MADRIKVLFVCTANRMRSRTAETMYRDDRRLEVRSAGTSVFADRVIDEELLRWADWVVVMEKYHVQQIQKRFPGLAREKTVVSLDIPDRYYYMHRTLMRDIKTRFEDLYTRMR